MPYVRKPTMRPLRPKRRPLMGFGDFTDTDQCSTIPIGDAYRKPGNYCATPDGGTTTFNADGSTYRAPGAVDPDPAHPAGAASSGGGLRAPNLHALTPTPSPPKAAPAQTGMSTTTMIALAGGALLLVALIAKR